MVTKLFLVIFAFGLLAGGAYLAWHFLLDTDSTDEILSTGILSTGDSSAGTEVGHETKIGSKVAEPAVKSSGATAPGATAATKPGENKEKAGKVATEEDGGHAGIRKKGAVVKKTKTDASGKTAGKLASTRSIEKIDAKKKLALKNYNKGNELIRKKKFKLAIRYFIKALKADRSLALAHRGLGISYAQMHKNKKACREYGKYMKMLPAGSKEIPTLKKILEGCH